MSKHLVKKKIEVENIDTGELEEALQLVCGCGGARFILYSLGKDHCHIQCTRCEATHCSNHAETVSEEVPIQERTESEGFNE